MEKGAQVEGDCWGGRRGLHAVRDSRRGMFEQCATGRDENGICHAGRTGGGFEHALPASDVVGVDGVSFVDGDFVGLGAG